MRVAIAILAFSLSVAAIQAKKESSADLANGFGDDIDWIEWPKAVSTALDLNKPIFLLIHKTWCGACKALKTSLSSSSKHKEFVELSKKFIMTNTEDDDEPEDEEYAPDGRYIPRLFFLDKYGKALAVDNKKNYANNAYYFPQMTDVLRGMRQALKLYEKQAAESPDEPVKLPKEKNVAEAGKEEINVDRTKEEKAEEKSEDVGVVETPGDEHLGEMHLTEDQLAFMESGGCPHAAAARAAIIEKSATNENVETEEDERKDEKEKHEKKKENGNQRKPAKPKDEKAKNEKTKDEKTKDEKRKDKKKAEKKTEL